MPVRGAAVVDTVIDKVVVLTTLRAWYQHQIYMSVSVQELWIKPYNIQICHMIISNHMIFYTSRYMIKHTHAIFWHNFVHPS